MADNGSLRELSLQNVENKQCFTILVPENLFEKCSSDPVIATQIFNKIEELFTTDGMPKEKSLGYVESLRVLQSCNLLVELVNKAKGEAKKVTMNLKTKFDAIAVSAYNKEVTDDMLTELAQLAPGHLTPPQKVRFMELLASGVPDKVGEGRTSQALSQCSTDSQLSEQSSLSASQHADVHGLVKGFVSWTHEAIMLLIDKRRELNHLFESSTVTSRQAWLSVAADLKEKGHDYSWEDCRKKMVSLKNRHKTIKEKNNATGNSRNNCRYYEVMDNWLADDPAVIPKKVVSSMKAVVATPSSNGTHTLSNGGQSVSFSGTQPESLLEETTADMQSTTTPKLRKRRCSAYDDEPPQWFAEYQRSQQKMHEEKMALDNHRVSALESLVKFLQNQQSK